jgi:hypothetical protein
MRAVSYFVIPAKAGIQFLSFFFSFRRRLPTFLIPAEASPFRHSGGSRNPSAFSFDFFLAHRENRLTSL